jgi:hypothetical protein
MEPETDEKPVTTQKLKNPGRVEWGRKLGSMAKKRKLEREQKLEEKVVEDKKQSSPIPYNIKLISGVGASILIGFGIYYGMLYFKKPQISNEASISVNKKKENNNNEFDDF